MRLADFVIKFLERKKIDTVFTVSGGGSIFLCDALYKAKKIKYVACHHEQAVSYATESYARAKNKPGAAIVTTGPGGTNTTSGVGCCWIDSVPSIFISGQVYLNQTIDQSGLRQIGVQEFDIVNMVKPFTKYAVMVKKPNEIKYHLEKAYHLCSEGRPGPVWIDIPANIQNAEINEKNLKSYYFPKKNIKKYKLDKKIKKVAELFLKYDRPILHIGHGVKISNGVKYLRKIINKYHIPLALTLNASDLIESNHPSYIGKPGAFAERGSNFIIQNCNLYISVGTRLPFMVTGYNSKDFARKAKKIMVDIDKKETTFSRVKLEEKINCDATYFLKTFLKYLPKKINLSNNWLNYCKKVRKKYPIVLEKFKKQKKSINSYHFIDTLSGLLNNKDVVVTDMGLSFVGTHQAFKIKRGQKLYTNSGHAPMGWGLPAAIGAFYATKRKRIICLAGEGGFQMNIQELATVMHNKLPIKIFIYNNGGYLTIKQTQQLGFNNRIMGSNKKSGLSFPDYKKIAQSHKIKYIKIPNNKNLKSKINKILMGNKPVICELILDHNQEQMPKAINKRIGKKSVPTTFEDMYPFLSKEELYSNNYNS
jgi:acetolactate synthase I/II/III large subunit